MFRNVFASFLFLIPFIAAIAQETVILQPGPDEGKDAQLWSIHPDNNYGSSRKFVPMGWTFGGVPGIHRAIIDFDLSAIPPGSVIDEAWLYLYFYSDEPTYVPHTGENEAFLKLITTHWEEDLVSWNTQPFTTTAYMVNVPRSKYPEQDYKINVTGLVEEMHVNPGLYFGMMLQLENEIPYTSLMFASSDNADPALRPKLIITYLPCQAPEAGFSSEVINDRVVFQDLSSNSESWSWDFGDGDGSTLQNPEHYYVEYGSYYVCQIVENDCGKDTACMWVDYCQETNSYYEYIDNHDVVLFLDGSENAEWWSWDFGDGSTSELQNPEHSYIEGGLYPVCLTAGNSCSQDTYCDTIYHCTQPLAGFEYQVSLGKIIFSSASSGEESWWWSFGDGFYSELQNPEHYYEEYGKYYVCLTVQNDCGAATFCDTVDYCQVPLPGFTCHTDGMTVHFQDESTNALSCHWDFGNGFYSLLECPDYTYEQDGLYNVCLTVKNECGSSLLCDTVRVKRPLPETPELYMDIYPNPAVEYIYVDLPWSCRYNMVMHNSIGGRVLDREMVLSAPEIVEIPVMTLAPGVYVVRIESPHSRLTKKLVLSR